jgi:hypothetical protein
MTDNFDPPLPPEPRQCRRCDSLMEYDYWTKSWYCDNPNCPDAPGEEDDDYDYQTQKNFD